MQAIHRRNMKGKQKAALVTSEQSDLEPLHDAEDTDDPGSADEVTTPGAQVVATQRCQFARDDTFHVLQKEMGLSADDPIPCLMCFKPVQLGDDCVIDHLCPKRNDGPTHITNAAALHKRCNMWKGVGHIIQGPGIKALASLMSRRDSNTVVDEFMKLLDAEIQDLQNTLRRPVPVGNKPVSTSSSNLPTAPC